MPDNKKMDKRMFVYVDCPAALFPKLTAFMQAFAVKENTLIAVMGNLTPFDEKIQLSVRKSINEVCKTTDATQGDLLEALKLWHEKTEDTHKMVVVQFNKKEEGCEAG